MKRVLSLALVLSIVCGLSLSCKKDKGGQKEEDTTVPQIAWESNSSFAEKEIAPGLEAEVSIASVNGLSVLSIEVSVPVTLVSQVNNYIGISSNKGTSSKNAVIDLVGDEVAVTALNLMGVTRGGVASYAGSKSLTIDFAALVNAIILNQVLDNASKFSFNITATDTEGKTTKKSVKFNWTSAPEITVPSSDVSAAAGKASVTVNANGLVEALTVTIAGDVRAVAEIADRTSSKSGVIDLIGDTANAVKYFSFPAESSISGKKSVTLDFSALILLIEPKLSSSVTVTVFVSDQFGKTATESFRIIP